MSYIINNIEQVEDISKDIYKNSPNINDADVHKDTQKDVQKDFQKDFVKDFVKDPRRISISKDTKSLFFMLQRYEENVKFLTICHFESAKYYRFIFNIIHYPALAVSIIINSALFSNYFEMNDSFRMFLVGNGITLLCNFFIALQDYYELEKLSEKHNSFAKEYARIYRLICNYYEDNLIYEQNIDKKNLVEFLRGIQSRIHLLMEESLKCPQRIIKQCKRNNIDLYFYVVNSEKLKNKYSLHDMIQLNNINVGILKKIVEYIVYNKSFHEKYPGHYRKINFSSNNLKKDIFNFLILEKNIKFDDIIRIHKSMIETFDIYELNSDIEMSVIELDVQNYIVLPICESNKSDELNI